MRKVLCILNGLNRGGAETFMVKICNNISWKEIQIDFCISDKEKGVYEDELSGLGSKIFRITMKSENLIKSFFDIKKLVKTEKYNNVLLINEHSLSVLDLIAARCGGAKKLVMRSTNANISNKKLCYIHKIFKPLAMYVPNVMIAPSTEAALFTFGKRNVDKQKVHILKNGLQYEKFEFDEEKREKVRKSYNLEDKFIVGHVGRFTKQKNHHFLIDIFKQISEKKDDAVLMLVGTGGMQQEIREEVKTLGIGEKVFFLGVRDDVPALLSAMDVLVFPSFFEGMPNAIIEAQATGLPCVISDTITKEANITGLVKYLSLEKSAEEWAEEAMGHFEGFERRSYEKEFADAGYTIEKVTKRFTELVF